MNRAADHLQQRHAELFAAHSEEELSSLALSVAALTRILAEH